MFKRLVPNLMVADVQAAVDYYVSHFGFQLDMTVTAEQAGLSAAATDPSSLVYAQVKQGEVAIMFQAEASFKEDVPALEGVAMGASSTFYLETDDLDALYDRIKDQAEVVKPPFVTWYGMKEFYLRDLNGYVLTIGQPSGPPPA
jgi:uncharacterized glyoxalase superfamily protein PhnB